MFFGSFAIAAVLFFGVPAFLDFIGGLPLSLLNTLMKIVMFLALTWSVYNIWNIYNLISRIHKPKV